MKDKNSELNISAKSFITALIILFVLMAMTYILTFIIPSGSYERVIQDGQEVVAAGTYQKTEGGISFGTWILSPLLALGAEGGFTIVAIIIFLLIIGGVFNGLAYSQVLNYMLDKISSIYKEKKYTLLCVVSLFFMTLGALVGSFEECVPLVPLAIALAYAMGWDALTGLGMSILSIGCGFATGVFNPFTVGVAQELAGLAMFSGMSMRLAAFVIIYAMLAFFLVLYAKRIEKKGGNVSELIVDFKQDQRKEKALKAFVIILGAGIAAILASSFIKVLQDIIMPFIALVFLAAGTTSILVSGVSVSRYLKCFRDGVLSILPAVLLILMASSIKFTMTEAGIMDTILYQAMKSIEQVPNSVVILCIYLIVLVMNFFIASGSAKAFLLIPLIMPIAELTGISKQLVILAFAFGDGFSNLFYPTNPVLLISLGVSGVGYGTWAKWSLKIQIPLLVVTSLLLCVGYMIGY